MATVDGLPPDPLLLLRRSVETSKPPIPTTSPDPSSSAESNVQLSHATYLIFNQAPSHAPVNGATPNEHIAIPLDQKTRFISNNGEEVDLRSVYWCWMNKDLPTAEYIASCEKLSNECRTAGLGDVTVRNFVFAERIDLNNWLEGEIGEEDSEFIRSLDSNRVIKKDMQDTVKRAEDTLEDIEMKDAALAGGDEVARKREEDILAEILKAERKMGDRNTVLHGVKVQDFSALRKYSAMFLAKPSSKDQVSKPTGPLNSNPALRPSVKPANTKRRPEPIILLSPSASSLLRMQNIKSFLSDGLYTPAETNSTGSNILHLTRLMPNIDPTRPLRFILVDSPDQFRPDYWNRVVAVFTTGQTWQFKNYKWQQPAELFSHAVGVYVGWKGEIVPDTVKGWGRGVLSVTIDKGTQRWRDREVVEEIWSAIEARMRAMGWGKEVRR
ncbi:CDC73-domain-containing protein [Polychaeton citri CBS 116435]|uniref:CDC73-domain-containing protein n=1 Tax=Polychaeton citri CBS 116435 TaxID=1314669 RepID=A0A9P4QED7_9PEZI|nr:CDC73-domain-containing protein [Polychaeton citri CBS 116435]